MSWKVYSLQFSNQEQVEIASALLQSEGFEYFEEKQNLLEAYFPDNEVEAHTKESISNLLLPFGLSSLEISHLEEKNWNEEWERDYPEVIIDDFCIIRAPFHPESVRKFEHEIILQPKMAFGTGHHSTTSGVMRLMKSISFKDKKVLDMGAGTAVLGILAEKLGAKEVLAIDIDEWAFNNGVENLKGNNCNRSEYKMGGVELLTQTHFFEVVIANINRNILLEQIKAYSKVATSAGDLILSGFYDVDQSLIEEEAAKYNWRSVRFHEEKQWIALHLRR